MVIRKPLAGAAPGSHCFVWIPSIRAFQTHPFTIVSNTQDGGLELVLRSHSGFTKAVYDCASSETGTSVWASVDGPYRVFPNPRNYDRVVLIAGGTGATFTFGLAASLAQHLESDSDSHVNFIWAVRKRENLEWFADHLQSLCQQPSGMNMLLHVTRKDSEESLSESVAQNIIETPVLDKTPTVQNTTDKVLATIVPEAMPPQTTVKAIIGASEKGRLSQNLENLCDIKYEKLEAEKAISQTLQAMQSGQRVLIASCGPQSLTDLVRMTAARHLASSEISIEVHCETFGW